MATDFTYGKKQILAGGPIKPGGKDMPIDARTRVESYADIASIPNPHVGLKITVKVDETNNNKMTDYIVKSLKANSSGIANMAIDEVVRYVDYLGASSGGSVSQEDINTAVNNYLTEHPVQSGATAEQAAQIEANRTAIGDSNSGLVKEVNNIKNTELQNLNTAILRVNETVGNKSELPVGDENIIASINRIDGKTTTGNGLTSEQAQQLQTAYEHSQSAHVQASDIPSLDGYATETFVTNKISEAQLSGGEVDLSGYATKDELNNKANTSHTHITSDVTDLDLSNIDAASLNGKKLSNLMTKDEYDAIDVKEPNTIYLVDDDNALEGIPSYSVSDAGKVLAVNSTGTGLVWVSISSSGGGSEEPKTLTSISAVYNQGSTAVYPSTNLDSLKNNLTVTATYSDSSNSVISSGYSLSGNLAVGTSTITVTYSGKTTTFNVTVTEETTPTKTLSSISAAYTQGDTVVHPSTVLNNLKSNLVVTAHYDDNSTETVTNYTLSGNLTVGTSTITVTYGGKTTTFDVTVAEETAPEMDSAYSYLRVTVPVSATPEQSTLYLSKPIGGTMNSLYINDAPKDVPSGANQTTTSYSLNEGENIIKIKGNFTCWGSKCNINVLQLQNDLTTCASMFYGCPNIVFNATIPSTVTNTNSMFRGSRLVNGVDIPSSVTNTASMYQSVVTLKTPSIVPDNVTECNAMYDGCSSLQGTVNVPNSATNISKYLTGAGGNGEGISVTGINTSSVTNYSLAFFNAKITTIEQSFADLIKQPKPDTVTNAVCFRSADTNLSSPITIAEVHSDWKQ